MTSTPSENQLAVKAELIAAWPSGAETVIDWNDPNGPGPLVEALACAISDYGTDQVDLLRAELSPLSCSVAGIALWEQSLALVTTKLAQTGTPAQRRAQVIARLREYGQPTLSLIQSVLNAFLQYADQTQIVILESNRALVRAANQVAWIGSDAFNTTPATVTWTVRDYPKVSKGGAQVDLTLSLGDLSTLTVTLYGPDYSTQYPFGSIGVGALSSPWNTRGLWAADSSDVWAVGDGGVIEYYNGTAWAAQVSGTTATLYAISGYPDMFGNVLWAAGAGGTVVWSANNGTTWNSSSTGTTSNLYGVWGSTSVVWAVGAGGTAISNTGTWTSSSSGTTQDLLAVWGADASHVWAVGAGGVVLFWNGSTWAAQTSGTTVTLRGVWGSDSSDVWAVGDGGTILYWNGTTWAAQTSGTTSNLRAVWGSGGVVYAVGDAGTILYWTSLSGWVSLTSGTGAPLYAVWGSSSSDVWAGGPSALLHEVSGNWVSFGQVRLYFPLFVGHQIYGTWQLSVELSSGSGTLTSAVLLVEAIGRYYDFLGNPQDGLGAAMYQWGVVVEDAKLGAGYDLDGAALAVKRLSYARSLGSLIRRSNGSGALPAGQFAAIPDDPNSIPDACIPG